MSEDTVIFFLLVLVFVLSLVLSYQRFAFRKGTQAKIRQVNEKLEEIGETDSDEQIMIFTDDPVLKELGAQINGLLADRQRVRADFRRAEISSKKMLSNISHDIKTPLTVILGYLEIMRLARGDDEMLLKVEDKAKQVMDLIDQFFTLAKLEAGDMDIDLGRIDICEVCRENVLGFYDILLQKGFEVDLSIPETPVFVQGNGLGLTIAKGLAVQMGGDLFLDSTPDVKTTFTIKLKKIGY